MPYSAAAKDLMLNQLGSAVLFASLHSATPGSTGASELSGGSPAYARVGLVWLASSAGVLALNVGTPPVFNVPPSTTVAFVGLWSALTLGTYYGYIDVTDEVFVGQGTYQVTSGTLDLMATASA